ncbi:MAG: Ammonium transporter, partial [uncultured Thermomicrobiales bacterium]
GSQRGRYGMGSDVDGAGHADDPRAGLLLRRSRSAQKRPLDHHALVLYPGADQRPVGALGVHARVRTEPGRLHRRLRLPGDEWRRGNPDRLRPDDSPPRVRRLPDDVRGHHTGPDHGRLRRAEAVQGLRRLLPAVGHVRLRSRRALGLESRRVAPEVWGARLRRRHRCPHHLRRHRPRGGGHARQADRLRQQGRAGAAQSDLHRARRRTPLVRLVRLQRRQRAWRDGSRGERLPRHQHGRRHGRPDLDDGQLAAPRAAERARRGRRRGGRPGGDHPGRRLRRHPGFDPDRPRRGRVLLLRRRSLEEGRQARRRARRLCRPRRGRDLGCARDRSLRERSGQWPRRGQRSLLRQSGATPEAGGRRRGGDRLRRCGQLDHPQGDRPGDRPPRPGAGGGARPRHDDPRRARLPAL